MHTYAWDIHKYAQLCINMHGIYIYICMGYVWNMHGICINNVCIYFASCSRLFHIILYFSGNGLLVCFAFCAYIYTTLVSESARF